MVDLKLDDDQEMDLDTAEVGSIRLGGRAKRSDRGGGS